MQTPLGFLQPLTYGIPASSPPQDAVVETLSLDWTTSIRPIRSTGTQERYRDEILKQVVSSEIRGLRTHIHLHVVDSHLADKILPSLKVKVKHLEVPIDGQ